MPRTNALRLKGRKFGRLIVVEELERRAMDGHIYWLCRCVCGNQVEAIGTNLVSGNTLSCGCWQREASAASNKGRGRSGRTVLKAP